jgi:hypothetical protein
VHDRNSIVVGVRHFHDYLGNGCRRTCGYDRTRRQDVSNAGPPIAGASTMSLTRTPCSSAALCAIVFTDRP